VLLLFLLTLQLIGLDAAAKGRNVEGLTARWCSTIFHPAVAILANCIIRPINFSASNTTGCVDLPADSQYRWLTATVAVISVSLVFQLFDAAILVMVSNNTRWWGTGMKRPWFTMLAGNMVLVAILILGVYDSTQLPSSMTRLVWVFRYDNSLNTATVCNGTLTAPGVRGVIIGWTDGFLQSWGDTYFGS
jgi:hypothetical protein